MRYVPNDDLPNGDSQRDAPDARTTRLGGGASLSNEAIFRALIAGELRNGRLTAARRRRIVRYGASMGLSAGELGKLITQCRNEALLSEDHVERRHALRFVDRPPRTTPVALKIAMIFAIVILVQILIGLV